MKLKLYASDPHSSRGRRFAETPAPTRSDFQRDRDRIVHSSAFRRLVYKTQVFLNHEGDLFRTRLTHSLEVAQLARSIARALGLEEDLVEAIALAHDLGHTPFGHAGQDALDACMKAHGGFEHNLQSLRVVDLLEQRYPAYDGLNLCFETREGILKHCSRLNAERLEAQEPGGVGARFLNRTRPSLEAQLCNLADEIAYNAHDIDDGVRSGLLTLEQVRQVPLFDQHCRQSLDEYPALIEPAASQRLLYETIRRMLSAQVYDVIDATRSAIEHAAPADAAAVRLAPALVQFSPAMRAESAAMKQFLMANLYRHPQVMEKTERARQVVRELFDLYQSQPAELPVRPFLRPDLHLADSGAPLSEALPLPTDISHDVGATDYRAIADHIASMTDRFALHEHERLTGRKLLG